MAAIKSWVVVAKGKERSVEILDLHHVLIPQGVKGRLGCTTLVLAPRYLPWSPPSCLPSPSPYLSQDSKVCVRCDHDGRSELCDHGGRVRIALQIIIHHHGGD